MRLRLKKIFLLLGDIIFFYLGLFLALIFRYGEIPSSSLWLKHLPSFSFLLFLWLLIFYIANFYKLSVTTDTAKFLKKTTKSFVIATAIAIAFFYFTDPLDNISPKTNLMVFVLVFLIIFLVWRLVFTYTLSSYIPKTKIALISSLKDAQGIIDLINTKPHLGYKISFIFNPDKESKEIHGIPIFNRRDKLKALIEKKRINIVALSHQAQNLEELRPILFDCLPLKISFVSISNLFETISGQIPLDTISQTWFLENLNEGNKVWFDKIKRLYDFLLSLLILILSLPFYPIIALLIKLESQGPVFFKQTRSGQHNQPFTMIKFRTMKTIDNDYSLTQEKDKRITKFGNVLRKTRLDELPQLFNILKGEMSFVGPRPERPEFIEILKKQIPFYTERMLVKPGITGWDQISGEYHSPSYEDTIKKLQSDLFYIKNRSIYLDLSIILKTAYTILSKAGR